METGNEYHLIWGLQTKLARLSITQNNTQLDAFHSEAISIIRQLFGEQSRYEQELNSIYQAYPKVLSPYILMEPTILDEFTGEVSDLLRIIEKDIDQAQIQRKITQGTVADEYELCSAKLLEFELQGNITQEQKSTLASSISRLLMMR